MNKLKHMKDEKLLANKLISMIEDEPIRLRTENLLMWYLYKARICKRIYFSIMISSIIFNASIPLINVVTINFTNNSYIPSIIISIIAVLSSVFMSIATLAHFKENWERYRGCAELLKNELFLYITKHEKYSDPEKRDSIFIAQLSLIALEEIEKWQSLKNADTIDDIHRKRT